MKEVKMSIKTKQEILIHIQKRYKEAKFYSKSKILDEFVATTGYCRKYAISKLHQFLFYPQIILRATIEPLCRRSRCFLDLGFLLALDDSGST